MKCFSTLLLWSSLLAGVVINAAPTLDHGYGYGHNNSKPETLNGMIHRYNRAMKNILEKRSNKDKCNSKTVTIRKEWLANVDSEHLSTKIASTKKCAGVICPRPTVLNIRRLSIVSSPSHLSANRKTFPVHAIVWMTSLQPTFSYRTTSTSMAISMHGTDTSHGLMNKYSETNVATEVRNHTGTGPNLPMILGILPSLTEALIPWEETESLYLMVQRCFRLSGNSSPYHLELVADVSRKGPFPTSQCVAAFFTYSIFHLFFQVSAQFKKILGDILTSI
jgi:hypothetical protein